MKSFMAKTEAIQPAWYLVDATDKTLGRLASELAKRLRGKHEATFTPHTNMGIFFVIINAEKIRVTGNKRQDKIYHRHTGYPGGIKSESFADLIERQPRQVLEKAIKGMLPKGPLGRRLYTQVKVYAGDQHPHAAQQPKLIEIEELF